MHTVLAADAPPRRARRTTVQTLDSLKIPEALLKISTVTTVTGLSESSIRRRMAEGSFPQPTFRDGPRCIRWSSASIMNWLRAKQAAANS